MKQFISKVVAELIESCMLEDLSYKGISYQTKQKQIVQPDKLTLNKVDITIQGATHNFIKFENVEQLDKKEGVYIFVAKEDFSFTVKQAFDNFASIRRGDNQLQFFYACTPKINFFIDEEVLYRYCNVALISLFSALLTLNTSYST